MKANVPDKLYIISDEEGVILSLDNATVPRGDRYDFVDEAVFPFEDGTFEYTRTDAFIDKAVKWINEHTSLSEKLVIENFRKYMEGE